MRVVPPQVWPEKALAPQVGYVLALAKFGDLCSMNVMPNLVKQHVTEQRVLYDREAPHEPWNRTKDVVHEHFDTRGPPFPGLMVQRQAACGADLAPAASRLRSSPIVGQTFGVGENNGLQAYEIAY